MIGGVNEVKHYNVSKINKDEYSMQMLPDKHFLRLISSFYLSENPVIISSEFAHFHFYKKYDIIYFFIFIIYYEYE